MKPRANHELCVLFLHHRNDPVTRKHIALLREHNPNAAIVPLTFDVPEPLPDAVDVLGWDSRWKVAHPWRNIDEIVYRWFENRPFDAERYIILEYDCLCTVDLKRHYASVWDADVAACDLFTAAENPDWMWFSEIDRLAEPDRRHAAAIVPFVGTMYSHSGLLAYLAAAPTNDLFCEFRMGTTVRKAGLTFARFPLAVRRTILWHQYPYGVGRPGLYHAIKTTDPDPGVPPGPFRERIDDWCRHSTPSRSLCSPRVAVAARARRTLAGLNATFLHRITRG